MFLGFISVFVNKVISRESDLYKASDLLLRDHVCEKSDCKSLLALNSIVTQIYCLEISQNRNNGLGGQLYPKD